MNRDAPPRPSAYSGSTWSKGKSFSAPSDPAVNPVDLPCKMLRPIIASWMSFQLPDFSFLRDSTPWLSWLSPPLPQGPLPIPPDPNPDPAPAAPIPGMCPLAMPLLNDTTRRNIGSGFEDAVFMAVGGAATGAVAAAAGQGSPLAGTAPPATDGCGGGWGSYFETGSTVGCTASIAMAASTDAEATGAGGGGAAVEEE